jgi:hypothetical protein
MRVKDWNKFQHFKDRTPPWIKLYRGLLDDLEWHELDPSAAKTLVMIWLMASEDDGRVPCLKKLAFRLRQTESKTSDQLSKLSHWLEQDDIDLISERHQVDAPETETETETETKAPRKRDAAPSVPDWLDESTWNDFVQMRNRIKKPMAARAVELIWAKLDAMRGGGADPVEILNQSIVNSWQDVFPLRVQQRAAANESGNRFAGML